MFTIKKKPLTPNIIWDDSTGKLLCSFGHRGTLTTNDRKLAEQLAAMGHEIIGETDVLAPVVSSAENAQPEEPVALETEKEPETGPATQEPEKELEAEEPGETAETPASETADPPAKGKRKRK